MQSSLEYEAWGTPGVWLETRPRRVTMDLRLLDMTGLRRARDSLREVVRVAEHAPHCARIDPVADIAETHDSRRFVGHS